MVKFYWLLKRRFGFQHKKI